MATATPLLDKLVTELLGAEHTPIKNRHDALIHIRNIHDVNCGLFEYAKQHGYLVDGSATEINIQFYTAYNAEVEPRY